MQGQGAASLQIPTVVPAYLRRHKQCLVKEVFTMCHVYIRSSLVNIVRRNAALQQEADYAWICMLSELNVWLLDTARCRVARDNTSESRDKFRQQEELSSVQSFTHSHSHKHTHTCHKRG